MFIAPSDMFLGEVSILAGRFLADTYQEVLRSPWVADIARTGYEVVFIFFGNGPRPRELKN